MIIVLGGIAVFFLGGAVGLGLLWSKKATLSADNRALFEQVQKDARTLERLQNESEVLNRQYQAQQTDYLVLKAEKNHLSEMVDDQKSVLADLTNQRERLQQTLSEFKAKLAAQSESIQRYEVDVSRLNRTLEILNQDYKSLQLSATQRKEALLSEQAKQMAEIARLTKYIEASDENAREKIELLENAKLSLKQQFENLANRIFEEKGQRFSEQNRTNITDVLTPFREEIGAFRRRVDDIYGHEAKERAGLKREIDKLYELNQTMHKEASNLTRALKGDRKKQGDWGEVILERVLEASGLRAGEEYIVQKSYKGQDGGLFRPDVIVKLPDDKDIIIDSKVSLSSYEAYSSSDHPGEQQVYLKKHIQAIKNHIDGLSNKDYERLDDINSLDFILMFIPIEAAFVLAFQHDKELFSQAFNRRIIVVTPTTLLATLGTMKHAWKHHKLSKNAYDISERAGRMLDKFRGFVDELETISKHIDRSRDSMAEAMKKLSKGSGNLVSQTLKLQKLGVSMKKPLPKQFIEQAEIEMITEQHKESE
ncbi:MAG: DNA recombination protein RmuC [Francisellaceae bacterium]